MTAPPLHCVYRLYDAGDRLIYIGATSQPIQRFDFHRRHTWWFELAVRVEPEWHPTREAAFAAEAIAIQEEQPAFNVTATGRDYGDFAHLTENDLATYRGWRPRRHSTSALPMALDSYVYELDAARKTA